MLPPIETTGGLVRGLLNRGFTGSAGRVLAVLAENTLSGTVQQRLKDLEVEARRLDEAGERLQPDNAVLATFWRDYDSVLRKNAQAITVAASDIQASGVQVAGEAARQLALPGLSDADLDVIGIRWNKPDPEAVNLLVNYADHPAWAAELAKYGDDALSIAQNQAVLGIVNGWNPIRTAYVIRDAVEGYSLSQAENLMRTLQLTSYRSASAIQSAANSDIITRRIRVAVLDDRTCMSCIALHGTELKPGERVDDHHRGRCTALDEVIGFPRQVQSGEDWFNSLPEERQLIIAGPGKLEAIQSGRARLRDFVHVYEDPVFGRMVREGSLKALNLTP
jgi:hypothetical protein